MVEQGITIRERLIDYFMRGLKPGASESLHIDMGYYYQPVIKLQPHMKFKPIWVTLKSDLEAPYKTRQIRCYIASDIEGIRRH
jgi:hypothetical protein